MWHTMPAPGHFGWPWLVFHNINATCQRTHMPQETCHIIEFVYILGCHFRNTLYLSLPRSTPILYCYYAIPMDPLLNTTYRSAIARAPSQPEKLCGRPLKLLYQSTGQIEHCQHPVKLRVCRGTNSNPIKAAENKGFWFESCNQRLPEGSHFHRWRRDLPRVESNSSMTQNPFLELLAMEGCTMQSLLDVEVTPQHCPPILGSPLTTPQGTPSSRFRNNSQSLVPSPFKFKTPRKSTNTLVSDLSIFDNSFEDHPHTPTAPRTPTATPGRTPTASARSLPIPQSTANVLPNEYAHTRKVIHKRTGKATIACNGPICRSNPAKDPVRFASGCTHEFCKKCCIRFQKDGASQCAQNRHQLPSAEKTDEDVDKNTLKLKNATVTNQAPAVELDEYDRNRPFSAAHYNAKDTKQRELGLKTDQLIRTQVAQESLKRSVELIFWKVRITHALILLISQLTMFYRMILIVLLSSIYHVSTIQSFLWPSVHLQQGTYLV